MQTGTDLEAGWLVGAHWRVRMCETVGMRWKINRKWLWGLALCVGVSACYPMPKKDDESITVGKVAWADDLLVFPKHKSIDGLKSFGRRLVSSFSSKALPTSALKISKRQIFGSHYLKSVSEVGGLPREQSEKVLTELLDPMNRACGGAGCAVVFGVKNAEVPVFLDNLLDEVGTSAELAKTQNNTVRKRLLGSLIPFSFGSKSLKPRDYVSSIYRYKPIPRPAEPKAPREIFSADDIKKIAGEEFTEIIFDYTTKPNFAKVFREIELKSVDDLTKSGVASADLNRWMSYSNMVFAGLNKIPKVSSPVYRGMQNLDAQDIAIWVRAWQESKPIGLGYAGEPATTSASWSVDQAMRFVREHISSAPDAKYAVLLEISNHRGVAIEKISDYPMEKEVLLPRDLKVIIDAVVPMEKCKRTFIIKMRGVNTAQGYPVMVQSAILVA